MKKRIYILVPGIFTSSEDAKNWAPFIATDINVRTEAKGDEFRYETDAIFRRLHQQSRAEDIANLALRYWKQGFEIVLVGHSNGTDLICRCVQVLLSHGVTDVQIHLFAAACEASFDKNGLNKAMEFGTVKRVYYYRSDKDKALSIAARLSRIFSPFGLGYGTLGIDGAKDVYEAFRLRVVEIYGEGFGHSTWFDEAHWEATFKYVTVAEWNGEKL